MNTKNRLCLLSAIAFMHCGVASADVFFFSDPTVSYFSLEPDNAADLAVVNGDYLTDSDTAYMTFSSGDTTFDVFGANPDGSSGTVILDLVPDNGGLAVDGNGTDNMNDGEVLRIMNITSGATDYMALNNVVFANENHGNSFSACGAECYDVMLQVYMDSVLVDTLYFDITSANYSWNLWAVGDEFVFTAATGSENWYIQRLAVPEPAMLALFGLGLAGIGFSRRRRAR